MYGYPHFVNDAGGSICELNDSEVITRLAQDTLIVYLKPSDELLDKIVERSLKNPKPMYYQDSFLDRVLAQYLAQEDLKSTNEIEPKDFFSWMFPRLVEHRLPLYQEIAEEYGIVVEADKIDLIENEDDFINLVCEALG